ncbi:hypothetical protein JXB01_02355 [Candidatus Micrarchaeota archaeon]|nr:hypothetical protein [Candidatus Micrarchaeota archaeon]
MKLVRRRYNSDRNIDSKSPKRRRTAAIAVSGVALTVFLSFFMWDQANSKEPKFTTSIVECRSSGGISKKEVPPSESLRLISDPKNKCSVELCDSNKNCVESEENEIKTVSAQLEEHQSLINKMSTLLVGVLVFIIGLLGYSSFLDEEKSAKKR